MKILLVEDDKITATALAEALTTNQYTVEVAADGEIGLQLVQAFHYDLILLDVVIPKLDGISLCRQLRVQGHQMPILLLTALDTSTNRVIGLEAGADDYMVKPYELPELIARIRALLRRGSSLLPAVFTWEKLRLDPDTNEVTYGGNPLRLTPKEYKILKLFLENPRQIFSRSNIIDRICSVGEFPGEEAVTTQIKGLRQKLKAAGMTTDLIETVYGLGYRLKPAPDGGKGERGRQGKRENLAPCPDYDRPCPPEKRQSEARVMAVVAAMWEEFKEGLREQVALFERAIAALSTGTLDDRLRQQAKAQAHQLIGSLGTFGLSEGSKVAREIEQLLHTKTASGQGEALRLEELVGLLKRAVENQPSTTAAAPASRVSSARMLMIDDDTVLTERIKEEAFAWGLQVEVATDLTTAREAIARKPPDVILLDLIFPNISADGLTLLREMTSQNPAIPVLVISGDNQLSNRVEVARLGGYAFLQKPITSEQILKAATQALKQTPAVKAKVIVVDDDPHLLTTLCHLLPPLGLQVTTLPDPQQFWEVLEATTPNLLILDVNMPGFNGMELCKAVRNDWRWNKLPILFLSAYTDAETVQRAFTVGADDFVSKPILESELISRILNRLERSQNLG